MHPQQNIARLGSKENKMNEGKCLFCGIDHKSTEPCGTEQVKSPSQALTPSLVDVIDKLIVLTATSNCRGECGTEEPFKLCGGCIAGAALACAAKFLCSALEKSTERENNK